MQLAIVGEVVAVAEGVVAGGEGVVVAGGGCDGVVVMEYVVPAVGDDAPLGDPDD